MTLKNLIVAAALFLTMPAIGQQVNMHGKSGQYDISAFSNFNSLPINRSAINATTKIVNSQFPGWSVNADKLNSTFSDIFGTPMSLSGNDNTERANNCMLNNLAGLGVISNEWKQTSNYPGPKADYLYYVQYIANHQVVFSRLSFRFTKEGALERIQMNNYGRPAKGMKPSISIEDAKKIAVTDMAGAMVSGSPVIDAEWSWFPVPAKGGYDLHPAWHFKVNGKVPGSVPLKLDGYIDATNGAIIYRTNEVKETGYDITVKGVVFKDGTLNPSTSQPLPNLALQIGVDTFYTDTAGYYANALVTLPDTTTIPLFGKWSTVIDSITGNLPAFSTIVSATGTTYTYPTTAPCSDRHINAYYHVNRVHNFMKGYFPTFTGMDFSLPTNVDLTSGTCNAFYSGTDINFYQAGGGCNSFSEIGDVIYHEYGHGISDHWYTLHVGSASIRNGALNEACSDIWAMSITRSPILGANSFTGVGGFIRKYDMTPQVYPIDLETRRFVGDVHKNGQIIAGCWWDVGVNIGSIDSMTKLFTEVYYDVPDGANGTEGRVYQTILIDALMADDNDHNLSNGTPHYSQIVAAFAKHGIYLEGDATFTHTEINTSPDNTPITVTAGLDLVSNRFFKDLTLYYRINDTGSWISQVMTNTLFTFTGTIPGQALGTVVDYYFIMHDSLGNDNGFFPITCNPALPFYQRTIPYQFAVGIQAVDSNDFEGSTTGWHIANNTGDNATGGKWAQGVPVPNTFFDSWPSGDNTTGTGKCLITGSGTAGGGFFGQGVTNGTSTVISPVFDISTFTTPIVEYYRWFSNEQNFSNFKNDPWIVKVRDASSSSWTTVEATYQCDINWRRRIFRVDQYVPTGTTQIQLKFYASDSVLSTWSGNGQSTSVGGLDDFAIYDKGTPVGVNDVKPAKAEIFPNPADEQIQVVLQSAGTGTIRLYDNIGRVVAELSIQPNQTKYTINTTNLSAGQYNLILQTKGLIQSKKVVVMHQ